MQNCAPPSLGPNAIECVHHPVPIFCPLSLFLLIVGTECALPIGRLLTLYQLEGSCACTVYIFCVSCGWTAWKEGMLERGVTAVRKAMAYWLPATDLECMCLVRRSPPSPLPPRQLPLYAQPYFLTLYGGNFQLDFKVLVGVFKGAKRFTCHSRVIYLGPLVPKKNVLSL